MQPVGELRLLPLRLARLPALPAQGLPLLALEARLQDRTLLGAASAAQGRGGSSFLKPLAEPEARLAGCARFLSSALCRATLATAP